MSEKILVPVLGESITEATVSKWLKNEGEKVEADEPIVELETDKVNLEVPSPVSGVLDNINSKDGSVVEVGAVLGSVTESGTNTNKTQEIKKIEPTINENNVVKLEPQKELEEIEEPEIFDEKKEEEPLVLTNEVKEKKELNIKKDANTMSPAVRKIIAENKIDIKSVKGTGKDGRVLKGDLINLMGSNPPPSERKIKYGQEERIKMTRLRQTIAKRLKQAQENAALLTTFNEVDMTSIMSLRSEYKDHFEKEHKVRLGFMGMFVKASISALNSYPAVNAEINGDDIIYKKYNNIGVAVGTPQGLVVPIIKDAQNRSLAEIEKAVNDMGLRAREGKIGMDELSGGTFTISNGGVYGSLMSTPILNPPQSGILGIHKIQKRPIAVGDDIKIRPMMYLAFSYDHRIIDGREAVSSLVKIKEIIEDPRRLILDI